jgi:translation initiation factor eIF-2B subunit epsilon
LKTESGSDDFADNDWGSDESDEEGSGGSSNKVESKVEHTNDEIASDPAVVGPEGKGRVWTPPIGDDELDEEGDHGPNSKKPEVIFGASETRNAHTLGYDRAIYYQQLSLWQEEHSDDLSEEDDDDMLSPMESADLDAYDTDAVTFDDTEPGFGGVHSIVGRQKGVDVVKELKQICLEYEETAQIENLAIELNAFKFSQNASYADCTMAATLAILEKISIRKGVSEGKVVADFKVKLERWAPLLRKFSIGMEEEKSIVLALERCAVADNEMGNVLSTGRLFRFLLQTLHDEEIVSEDPILSWAADRRELGDGASPAGKLFALQPVQDFLEWLAESEDDDSEEEDDDED